MTTSQVQYVGFRNAETTRDYRLLVHHADGQYQEFIVAIAQEAFVAHRVRYQDAAEICFLKVRQALAAWATEPQCPPATRQDVTEDELREYREAHAPRPRRVAPRRPAEQR